MVDQLSLIGMKSKPIEEQEQIIKKFIALDYDTEELQRIRELAENLLDRRLDASKENIITLWILGVLAADIGTVMHPKLAENYKKNLERLCSEVDARFRDALTLSVRGDEMDEWFYKMSKTIDIIRN